LKVGAKNSICCFRLETPAEDKAMTTEYLFDNAAEREARARMAALAALHNDATFRYVEKCGIALGWNCLEIGAGDGSVARWMAARVGPTGCVLATDIDPRFALQDGSANPANMDVRVHDIVTSSLPEGVYDLIHARLVLVWLPARLTVLDKLVKALRPGGWLLIEDYDTQLVPSELGAPDPTAAAKFFKMKQALLELMSRRGLGHTYARELHHRLRERGLMQVESHGAIATFVGGSPGADLQQANFRQVHKAAIEAGLVSEAEFEEAMLLLSDPQFTAFTSTMFSAMGRKPETPRTPSR
jgi:SAM-dependent methyltransferase